MNTKQEIQQFLAQAGISPNQRRGQNFLIDLNLMQLIVEMAHIRSNDTVLEVGCGTGSLTSLLVEKAAAVISVEIEQPLAQIAARQLSEYDNLEIINSDALQSKNTIDSKVIEAIQKNKERHQGRLLLVANLPYSVACPVMMNLVTGPVKADAMYVTVQKEVAERMKAAPGNKDYGIISIILHAIGTVKIERILKPSVFWPAPQVDSAMVSFVTDNAKQKDVHDLDLLCEVVSLFMGHRRKMLKACTKLINGRLEKVHNWPVVFADCFVDHHKRPEEIPVESYIAIANLCAEQIKTS